MNYLREVWKVISKERQNEEYQHQISTKLLKMLHDIDNNKVTSHLATDPMILLLKEKLAANHPIWSFLRVKIESKFSKQLWLEMQISNTLKKNLN